MSENSNPQIPIDPNKIFTELALKMITGALSESLSKGKGIIKRITDDTRLKLETSYRDYLKCAYERYSKAKSFLIRDESTLLYDFYIPAGIKCGKREKQEASIFNFEINSRFSVIKGSAGSGKSMLMRYLFLQTIEKQVRIPIFVELRKLNNFEGTVLDYLLIELSENKFALDKDYLLKALEAGHFAIFFDGFDELSASKREGVTKEISKIIANYDKNIIIISSRPDDEFSSWNLFDIWTITPLDLEQALKLVRKVPAKNIDTETRKKFLVDLENDLFDKHKSFLSNPLLLSIMVITYANSGDVPQKQSIFFESAYTALYEKHDALKGAFKRERKTPLDILEFKKIFSAFSTITFNILINTENYFLRTSLRFSKTDGLNLVNTAKEISDVTTEFKSEDFLQDCIKAVCLLMEDGLDITFAHRSFQEYFTATFISNLDNIETRKILINSYLKSRGRNVIDLLCEINPLLVEKEILIPVIENLERIIGFKNTLKLSNFKKFIQYRIMIVAPDSTIKDLSVEPVWSDDSRMINQIFFIIEGFYKKFKDKKHNFLLEGVFIDTFFSGKESDDIKLNDILNNSKAIKFLENTEWIFCMDNLRAVLQLKEELIKKHRSLDEARSENLLKGLIKVKN